VVSGSAGSELRHDFPVGEGEFGEAVEEEYQWGGRISAREDVEGQSDGGCAVDVRGCYSCREGWWGKAFEHLERFDRAVDV